MRRPSGVRRSAVAAAAVLVLAACTSEPDAPDVQQPTEGPAPVDVVDEEPTLEPLVLAVHATRPAPRIGPAVARAIISNRVFTWEQLDRTKAPLRVVRGPRAARVLARNTRALAVVPASEFTPTMRAVVVGGVDPLLDPESYPLRVTGPTPEVVTTVTVVGDVMLGRRVGAAARQAGDVAAPLRPMQRLLAVSDLTVGNLENTLSTVGPPQQGGDSFAAPPSILAGLADAGFDAISLANNHTGDYGQRALLDTVDAFEGSAVRAFGAGRNLAAAGRPVVLERAGVRFGFLGFNAIGETPRATPGRPGALSVRMPPRTGPLNRGDLRHVLDLVRDLSRKVDVVVVLPHWGTQYTHVAEPVQTQVGKQLVDAGADLVAGGHPHWVQGLEAHDDGLIAHSLGNFVFDMDFMQQTQEGVILTATFWGNRLKAVNLSPYVIGRDFAPRAATGRVGAGILADVWANSVPPFRG